MKRILVFVVSVSLFATSCKTEKKEAVKKEVQTQKTAYASFGEEITDVEVISADEMRTKFENLTAGDTVTVKFASTINEVCKKKGCWMKLDLGNETESMVRFKDYGFFMPLDSDKKEVIVEGKAFINETPVEELRHYAEDAGKSKEEIEQITESKKEYTFIAHGVLMK
ncbi:DUF4920 domain-containing protein [Tenacibaculum crassostreae]|uniref:DUF4920 domain-containing protein n=1 Tax=Tenacibaculum crassostreae TaxID=502683 RepID=UPI003893815D